MITVTFVVGIRNNTVQRSSKAGVKRNVPSGEKSINKMIAVTCGRRTGSAKDPGMRATKKHAG